MKYTNNNNRSKSAKTSEIHAPINGDAKGGTRATLLGGPQFVGSRKNRLYVTCEMQHQKYCSSINFSQLL